MKKTYLIYIFLFAGISLVAQSSGNISEEEMFRISEEVKQNLSEFRADLEKTDFYLSEEQKRIQIDFQCDTFAIERTLFKRLEIDYTTAGMTQALYDAESAYDQLLNKYYKLLKNMLNDTDREILKQSQRNWILFRDSERTFNHEISKEAYSGGGTIQQLFISDKYLEITKKRVEELYGYVSRIIQF